MKTLLNNHTLNHTKKVMIICSPFSTQKVLYFDYQSTTPLDPRVLDAMMPFFT